MSPFDQTSAAYAVLIEVANVLGAFRDQLVLVGGWVPELLYPKCGHTGSIDVDIAVAPTALTENVYETICRRMLDAGYSHHIKPTHFLKGVPGVDKPVKVDLISGQYGEGEKTSSVQVNELQLSSLRGIDLAFEACEMMEISGIMPDGARNTVRVRIVRPEVFILIKAFAMDERWKEKTKDAYDIVFVLQHFKPDLATLADRVRPHVTHGLGREAYGMLKGKFASIDSVGPVSAARVLVEQGIVDEPGTGTGTPDLEQAERAAFEYAQELFRLVDLGT